MPASVTVRRPAYAYGRINRLINITQDFDPKRENFGSVAEHPELYDINFCPPGGKAAQRNQGVLRAGGTVVTGERDWLHVNGIS